MKKPSLRFTHFVGCIVQSKNGKILCQLRDKKSGIAFPGYWTCTPGGHVEKGEGLHQAISRELAEEFEIRVRHLKFFRTTLRVSRGIAGRYHFFVAELKTPLHRVKCLEGQRVSFFSIQQVLRLRQHPLSLWALRAYLSTMDSGDGLNGWMPRGRRVTIA